MRRAPETAIAARRGAAGARVIPIQPSAPHGMHHCAEAGFETVVSVPVRLHDRLMGEVDLFFHAQIRACPTPSARCSRR